MGVADRWDPTMRQEEHRIVTDLYPDASQSVTLTSIDCHLGVEAVEAELDRLERFVERHGRHQAWRVRLRCETLLARPISEPHRARALVLNMEAQRSGFLHARIGPLVDAAYRIGLGAFPAPAQSRMEAHRLFFLISEALYGNADQAAKALLARPDLENHVAVEALLARANAVSMFGDLVESERLLMQALARLLGDRSAYARYLRANLHLQWSFCIGRAAHRIDLAEMHLRAASRLARASGSVPLLPAIGRNMLSMLSTRKAGLAERRAVIEPILRTLHSRRIDTPIVGMMLSNYAFSLANSGAEAEAGRIANLAWGHFERAGFPLKATIYFALLEFSFDKAGDRDMCARLHAQWRINERLEKGRSEPMRYRSENAHSALSEGYLDIARHRMGVRREAAMHVLEDSVTGLATSAMADDMLEGWHVCTAGRADEGLIAMLVDIDDFSVINETHGHALGDRLLQGMGARLRALSPALCARVGADEFLVVARVARHPEVCFESAVRTFEQAVVRAVTLPMPSYVPGLVLTACAGLHVADAAWPDAGALRRWLSVALAQARQVGPGCIAVTDVQGAAAPPVPTTAGR